MTFSSLTALPVYNEVRYVDDVIDEVSRYASDVLVVDDGSTDGTSELLLARNDISVVTHSENRGYGAALISAFQFAIENGYDCIVTIDCDGQHEPQRIPQFVVACRGVDIVSGSRYLESFSGDSEPPAGRRRINHQMTAEVNRRLGLSLTDAFCGFKAYNVASLKRLRLSEPGYAMPLELWVQASAAGFQIIELPVPLIYLDEARSFGGALDDGATRLNHYHEVLDRSMRAAEASGLAGSISEPAIEPGTALEGRARQESK
ncbi:MAG: glycosyltransferase family 2 protein [Planctomycetes bacterium]|nr:glycosyltransferase family 2 protein [Planctomycetota bacterium]MBL7037694.1 glycosyltransferase family 2 protein [Pirellulaceae bacterium]